MNTAPKIVSILIAIVLLYSLVGCGEDEPLTGRWIGTLTDTSLLESWLLIKIVWGEEVTFEEYSEMYKRYVKERDVELQLEQSGTRVVGSITIDKQTMPIQNGSFVGNVLTFSYIEGHFLSESEEITVSAELIDESTLKGEWSDKGSWQATKMP